jgi:hypothetical protein
MKPYLHGRIHARKYGGVPDDYADIDDFIDSSKMTFPDIRHRSLLHSSFGCYIVEQMFGRVRTNSAGITYSPRDVAEDHIIQDLGFIPTPGDYLNNMKPQPWMSGTNKANKKETKFIPLVD